MNLLPLPQSDSKYFLPYQLRWLDDDSPLKIMEKSRQIGMTYVDAYDSVIKASSRKAADVYVSSRDLVTTRLYLEQCIFWARFLKIAAENIGEQIIQDDKQLTPMGWSHHRVTIHDAVEQGLVEKINEMRGCGRQSAADSVEADSYRTQDGKTPHPSPLPGAEREKNRLEASTNPIIHPSAPGRELLFAETNEHLCTMDWKPHGRSPDLQMAGQKRLARRARWGKVRRNHLIIWNRALISL